MVENSIHLTIAHHDSFNSDVTEASFKFYLWKRNKFVEAQRTTWIRNIRLKFIVGRVCYVRHDLRYNDFMHVGNFFNFWFRIRDSLQPKNVV